MSKKTDSNGYTLIFAIGMVLVVGALLAFTASSLKPMINANIHLNTNLELDKRTALEIYQKQTLSLLS